MIAFIDLETTGLSIDCAIVEVACVITDDLFNEIDSFHTLVDPGEAPWQVYAALMHSKTGLLKDLVYAKPVSIAVADEDLSGFLLKHNVNASTDPYIVGGSSVHFDTGFIEKYLSISASLLHYRHLDVTSLKMLFSAAMGIPTEDLPPKKSETKHRAMEDIQDSIAGARIYKNYIKYAWENGLERLY